MGARIAIVVAADAGYYPWLDGLLASLEAEALPFAADICLFDLGLTEQQRQELASRTREILIPGWAIDFPQADAAPSWYRAMVNRPFLPTFFPGYEFYFWFDVDLWVQDVQCLRDFLVAAEDGSFAIVPERFGETKRYATRLAGGRVAVEEFHESRLRASVAQGYRECFGSEYERHAAGLIRNTGAFAARGDSKGWAQWQQSLAGIMTRGVQSYLAEQSAFNVAALEGRIPCHDLPFRCNWNLTMNHPLMDAASGKLLDPADRQPIGILHFADVKKLRGLRLKTTDGRELDVPFMYREFRARYPGTAPV